MHMMHMYRRIGMRCIRIGMMVLMSIAVVAGAEAQTKKKSSKKPKQAIGTVKAPAKKLRPTTDYGEGSVGRYFYPVTEGSEWTLRTVKSLYDHNNMVLASDTLFSTERVITNAAKSLQGLPLIKCESYSYKPGHEASATEEVTYYVDDSLIMAVMNNSVSHGENRALLTTPLRAGFVWPEKWDDSVGTEIVSLNEAVETPAGKFDNALVTVTRLGHGELAKYFVPEHGIVKMVFRGPEAQDRGTIVVTTDLMSVKRGEPVMPVGHGPEDNHMPAQDGGQ